MGAERNRILIISLDGATFSVLDPLMQQGCLPNLARLQQQGLSAELESVIPPVTAPAWTSFMTGKHPGKHGIFDFTRFDGSDYSWAINSAQHIRSKTLWSILSEKGKRVVVLNLPYTYPTYQINGIMVAGWDAPAGEQRFSYPPEVSAGILERFPDYKSNLWVSDLEPLRSDEQFEEFTGKLTAGFEQQASIARDLLGEQDWDVFMVHFQQTDWIQHKLWTYIERACSHADDKSEKIEATRNCYRRFDQLVGEILRRVENLDPAVVVLSDHGFGRAMGNIYPNAYLKRWGYLAPPAGREREDKLKGLKDVFRNSRHESLRKLYRAAGRLLVASADGAGDKSACWTENTSNVLAGRRALVDWQRTRVATVWAYQMGFLYVNLAGRGPMGMVQPGEEYERILADLTARFREIRHPRTGEKLLQQVARGRDLYPQAAPGIVLPDLVLVPVDGYGFGFCVDDAPPEVSEEGTHRHNGVLFLRGHGIRRALSDFAPQLVDMAPTILHLLGLPVPVDMDGRVLEEIFFDQEPVRYENVDNSLEQHAQEYTAEEAELIEQRLKGLGYLE